MSYTTSTPIKGTSRGDPAKITAWAKARGCARPADVAAYLDTLYRLCRSIGLSAHVLVGLPAFVLMQRGVLRLCHHLKILFGVIAGVPVDVMDNFVGPKRAAKHFLSNDAMFSDVPFRVAPWVVRSKQVDVPPTHRAVCSGLFPGSLLSNTVAMQGAIPLGFSAVGLDPERSTTHLAILLSCHPSYWVKLFAPVLAFARAKPRRGSLGGSHVIPFAAQFAGAIQGKIGVHFWDLLSRFRSAVPRAVSAAPGFSRASIIPDFRAVMGFSGV